MSNVNMTPTKAICLPPMVYDEAADTCQAEPIAIQGSVDGETRCIEGDTCYTADELGFQSNSELDAYQSSTCADGAMSFRPVADAVDAQGNPLVIDICQISK